mmetsp:Transcript_34363/g.98954  ORF Transcript_34363/g.98954 Transcript_34363/m.98954 type:complete len:218 (-) Transcript_34363:934-1587(-)
MDAVDRRGHIGKVVQLPQHLGIGDPQRLPVTRVPTPPFLLAVAVRWCRCAVLWSVWWLPITISSSCCCRASLILRLTRTRLHAADLRVLDAVAVDANVGERVPVGLTSHPQAGHRLLLGTRHILFEIGLHPLVVDDLDVDRAAQEEGHVGNELRYHLIALHTGRVVPAALQLDNRAQQRIVLAVWRRAPPVQPGHTCDAVLRLFGQPPLLEDPQDLG